MASVPRIKFVVANAINMISEMNELLVHNARMGEETQMELPGMIERAYMIFHETGVVPMIDINYNTVDEV